MYDVCARNQQLLYVIVSAVSMELVCTILALCWNAKCVDNAICV